MNFYYQNNFDELKLIFSFNNSYLEFHKRKKINKKHYYNILTISKENKKYFESLKSDKDKDKFLLEKLSKEATEKYGFEVVFE